MTLLAISRGGAGGPGDGCGLGARTTRAAQSPGRDARRASSPSSRWQAARPTPEAPRSASGSCCSGPRVRSGSSHACRTTAVASEPAARTSTTVSQDEGAGAGAASSTSELQAEAACARPPHRGSGRRRPSSTTSVSRWWSAPSSGQPFIYRFRIMARIPRLNAFAAPGWIRSTSTAGPILAGREHRRAGGRHGTRDRPREGAALRAGRRGGSRAQPPGPTRGDRRECRHGRSRTPLHRPGHQRRPAASATPGSSRPRPTPSPPPSWRARATRLTRSSPSSTASWPARKSPHRHPAYLYSHPAVESRRDAAEQRAENMTVTGTPHPGSSGPSGPPSIASPC